MSLLIRFVARALAPCCVILAAASAARAQAGVSGRVMLVQGASGGHREVSSAVVFLEPVARLARYDHPAGDLATASIAMRDREFLPHVGIVSAGGSVDFPNQDPFSHNVFSNTSLGAFDLGLYRRGATRAATFPRVGVYAIYCNIHASMVSFVIAVPAKLYSRVDGNGQFSIQDVPPGRYLLHVWHENTAEAIEPIDIPATGVRNLALSIDSRGFHPAPHLNKFGQTYPPARADRY